MESKKLFFFIKLQYKSYIVEDIRVTYHVYDVIVWIPWKPTLSGRWAWQ